MQTQKQLNLGAALYTLTQHPGCEAVRALNSRSYLINGSTVVYFKYATRPRRNEVYQFTFTLGDVEEIDDLLLKTELLYLGLICVKHGEVCCLSYHDFSFLWELRQCRAGDLEEQFVLKVRSELNRRFRVTADFPGRRGLSLTDPLLVPRSDFPNRVVSTSVLQDPSSGDVQQPVQSSLDRAMLMGAGSSLSA